MTTSIRNVSDLQRQVQQYVAMSLEQDDAFGLRDMGRYNRLAKRLWKIEDALKAMEGDQRTVLVQLFDHRNFQVRLNAALATLAIAPAEARRVLEAIAASKHGPQSGDAGLALLELDRGRFRPT